MRAGILKHKIDLQSHEDVQDPVTGEITEIWETQASVWAEVAPLSGREFIAANAIQSEIRVRITIRYRDDVNSDWRILFRGQIYNIAAILPDLWSGLDYLTLPCTEGVNNG
ncbi:MULTISPECIES: phage head closure protein [Pantoea]|uniref:Phage head-tail adaptor, putative, SPP1 family n=1 Tax=Candidatus Pantoea floridensis TaxID=1938870 RepID=A0A286BZX1_9GAMM|nr:MULTISPECIES: phage head closure protein [Pantoea]PIF22183.1 SPP1 family predicted phage head-tail adaptor [Enterobacteriaceae bacterium JKS000233]PXW18533.1 SPP1 family predicted phage head-tail adaptor [Pantoea sp. JKS000250]SOD39690.1 phage head-tail adaptor, putative, SPP1 family [Pantoea floridensis]